MRTPSGLIVPTKRGGLIVPPCRPCGKKLMPSSGFNIGKHNSPFGKNLGIPRKVKFDCGHELDANTLALWRMNETVEGGDITTILDSASGARDLTANGAPGLSRAPNFAQYARWFTGGTSVDATRAGDATAVTTLLGSWTIEFWVYHSDATTDAIFGYGIAGETEATNYLALIVHMSTGAIQVFWETGAGANISFSTAASVMSSEEWHHVAVTKTVTTTAVVDVYVDGVLVGTSGALTNSTGGTSSQWELGVATGSFGQFRGGVRSIHVSSVVRTLTEIQADAARADHSHTVDGSTFALWQMDEAASVVDESTNGFDLSKFEGAFDVSPRILCDDTEGFEFDAATTYRSAAGGHPTHEPLRLAIAADYTVEAWIQNSVALGVNERAGHYSFGDPGPEGAADNYSGFIFVGRKGRFDHEHGSGVNSTYTMAGDLVSAADELILHHLAIVKFMSGADAFVEFWLDGVLIETSTALVNFDSGTSSKFILGFGPNLGGATDSAYWDGWIADMRVSDKRRTADEIADSASRV